jgi:glycosyltransferase involved in cell wall biosynthesis
MPKVSVLLPNYNSAQFLDESVSSVLNQTYTDFELIIVDNCSTDNSEEVISKYLSDKRIRYYRNETNIGAVGNFNKCLSYATGEYIKFLCSDDKFHPELLSKVIPVMVQHPTVSLAASYTEEFGLVSRVWEPPFTHLVEGKAVIHNILNNYNCLGHPTNITIRKSALKVGNFRSEYLWLADWEMWLRILSVGDCYIIPEILSYNRNHKDQVTKTMLKNFNNYFENYALVKSIKKTNELNLDFSEIDIDKLIKEKAIHCTLSIPWVLLGIQKKKNRQIFKKAFNVAYHEKVIVDSLMVLSKRLLKRVF